MNGIYAILRQCFRNVAAAPKLRSVIVRSQKSLHDRHSIAPSRVERGSQKSHNHCVPGLRRHSVLTLDARRIQDPLPPDRGFRPTSNGGDFENLSWEKERERDRGGAWINRSDFLLSSHHHDLANVRKKKMHRNGRRPRCVHMTHSPLSLRIILLSPTLC
ncbi:hypothetical protein C8F04DRAFT_108284 [Mycena alexandri]|uniref:Uncharacterized protein n=1 Tax=Mycena alexandri TaxID=1745969 RepID=A0AAD6SF53_9AGAR|nr:hypothetical protein C8F04DRAFT_108284 [Mycena alexandri]